MGEKTTVQEKCLIFIDILGFYERAEEISKLAHQKKSEVIRKQLERLVNDRVLVAESQGIIIGVTHETYDDKWYLVSSSMDAALKAICIILEHDTGYEGYERIPLEIGIGVLYHDQWAVFKGSELVFQKQTLELLKTNIIGLYDKWYEQYSSGQKPKSTFVVLTESAYNRLEPLDKKNCRKIEQKFKYEDGEKSAVFYLIDQQYVEDRARIFQFLRKIAQPDSKLYNRIDSVYVAPAGFDEIEAVLKDKRIVFITGTAEYGKTYTAVRLLWDYFKKGYEPVWVIGREEEERVEVRRRLEQIEQDLKPRRIIYFEDPFGKSKYERREGLEREIGTIIDCINRTPDVYVIITSWEEVFWQFEKEQLSSVEIERFERRLNIKRPSYAYEERKKILLQWAEALGCEWLSIDSLRNMILWNMHSQLPTPLSIKNFVDATINVVDVEKLREEMKEKSTETERNFATEIRHMEDSKILFLSFPFISEFYVEQVRSEYERLAKIICRDGFSDFEAVLGWFQRSKISIVDDRIAFSHPSYRNALKYLLLDNHHPSRINSQIFSRVLQELSENRAFAWYVANTLFENFECFSESVKSGLLLVLPEKITGRFIALKITNDLPKLAEETATNLVQIFSQRKETVDCAARMIVAYFDTISDGMRCSLLSELSQKSEAAPWVVATILTHFNDIPRQLRQELLLGIKGAGQTQWYLSNCLVGHFERLDEDERSKLLSKLLEDYSGMFSLLDVVTKTFDLISDNARNCILQKLLKKSELAHVITWDASGLIDKLPSDMRKELLEFVERSLPAPIAFLMKEYDKNQKSIGDSLVKLSDDDSNAREIARVIMYHFRDINENLRNRLLSKVAGKKSAALYVANAVEQNLDSLPNELRNALLEQLSMTYDDFGHVVRITVLNADKLSDSVITQVSNRKEDLLKMLIKLTTSNNLEIKFRLIEALSKLEPKFGSHIVLQTLDSLLLDKNEEVRSKAEKLKSRIERSSP